MQEEEIGMNKLRCVDYSISHTGLAARQGEKWGEGTVKEVGQDQRQLSPRATMFQLETLETFENCTFESAFSSYHEHAFVNHWYK